MQRTVFEQSVLEGFRTPRTESIAVTGAGKRLFACGGDGSLLLYECHLNKNNAKGFNCTVLDTIRKQSKEKKAAMLLNAVESWRVVLGIFDGVLMAYDSQFLQLLGALSENKGCHIYCYNEKSYTVIVGSRKKLFLYSWQSPGFAFQRDFNLIDVPKSLCALQSAVVVGYKKFYECINLQSSFVSRVLDIDRECRMATIELEPSAFRGGSLIVSLGTRGVVLDTDDVVAGTSFSFGRVEEERIEWSSSPVSLQYASPFLVSLLMDAIEIHDVVNFSSLQRIDFQSSSPLSLCSCSFDLRMFAGRTTESLTKKNETVNHIYVCNGDEILVMSMLPLSVQIEELVSTGMYEEAIDLCTMSAKSGSPLEGVDVSNLYNVSAASCLAKGDYEKAVAQYLLGDSNVLDVIASFPQFVADSIGEILKSYGKTLRSNEKLPAQVNHRAASALAEYCARQRPKVERLANSAEKLKERKKVDDSANPFKNDDFQVGGPADVDIAVVLDTVYVNALVSCNPSRRNAVVELLASSNRCQVECTSVLLASQGKSYMEALLWLYRSHNQHQRVLQALTVDKCVGTGAWNVDQFYRWTAEYLKWLWYSEDINLPVLALKALRQVLEYDAQLGMSALLSRPEGHESFGGKGVTIAEVLKFLQDINPGAVNKEKSEDFLGESISIDTTIPLINGNALAIVFLEHIVDSGEAPSNLHDEYAKLLIETNPVIAESDEATWISMKPRDSLSHLYLCYRKKLHQFLVSSTFYDPVKLLNILNPKFLHEKALILTRLGKYEDALFVYCCELKDFTLAETYCDQLFLIVKNLHNNEIASTKQSFYNKEMIRLVPDSIKPNVNEASEIYTMLFKVILRDELAEQSLLERVIITAEKYSDRVDAAAVLEILPQNTPIAYLQRYLKLVLEHASSKKRNLQIIHQLLRIHEVNLRTKGNATHK